MSSRGNTKRTKTGSKDKKQVSKIGSRSNSNRPIPFRGISAETSDGSGASTAAVPPELQQQLLNIFRDTFTDRFTEELPARLQAVKQHLYNRDFAKAFGPAENLEAYAARWSPSRALAYCTIFADLSEFLVPLALTVNGNDEPASEASSSLESQTAGLSISETQPKKNEPESSTVDSQRKRRKTPSLRISCLGGGAGAEVVGLAGYHKYLRTNYSQNSTSSAFLEKQVEEDNEDGDQEEINLHGANDHREESEEQTNMENLQIHIKAVDIADWGAILDRLEQSITSPPKLSQYASAAARAAAVPLISTNQSKGNEQFRITFKQQDVLDHSARTAQPPSSSPSSSSSSPLSGSAASLSKSSEIPTTTTTAPPPPPPPQTTATTAATTSETSQIRAKDTYSYSRAQSARFNFITQDTHLVTLMFTLNELYSASIPKATELLMTLTHNLRPGTLFLVVDSPGSYSTLSLAKKTKSKNAGASTISEEGEGAEGGKETKAYPMKYLLDLTLLRGASGDEPNKGTHWEKLVSDDSRWFRLPTDSNSGSSSSSSAGGSAGLRYPIQLENMRYQIHLYRRI
ncbi:hypothetical protein L228DRAFT_238150 [Xylona heveae TC161]|uniref:25S rRNA (Uridine(2843)-N(3))-methyltransferase n=1 Tax=Xylona heveae (strain CBS 132557 / TC161) TaxID=1328760 RepID=A0A165HJG4_XYLHT|nr:hypothetical protein L228DRAFT_238150 [Xylona heveae TC161]KZF23604.1 hypothetical protein L228DRAFT_238150 [Xylona heveae TC161]